MPPFFTALRSLTSCIFTMQSSCNPSKPILLKYRQACNASSMLIPVWVKRVMTRLISGIFQLRLKLRAIRFGKTMSWIRIVLPGAHFFWTKSSRRYGSAGFAVCLSTPWIPISSPPQRRKQKPRKWQGWLKPCANCTNDFPACALSLIAALKYCRRFISGSPLSLPNPCIRAGITSRIRIPRSRRPTGNGY